MSLKPYTVPRIAERLLSQERLTSQRAKAERLRVKAGGVHVVEFFHDPSDPYSQLLETALPQFQSKYNINLVTHLVSPPDASAAREREKLSEYSKVDAMRLAEKEPTMKN